MSMLYLENVVTLRLDAASCVGCGRCVEVCPHAVFTVESGKARIRERDACMECGACARNCPSGAIAVSPDSKKAVITTALCHQCTNCSDVCPKGSIRYGKM